MLKGVGRHDRIDRRDERRRAGEPGRDEPEARVGRRGRAHDHVEIEIAAVVAEPLPAIVAVFVDDDRHLANADRAKPVKRVVDQRSPADRRHRLADAIAVGPSRVPWPAAMTPPRKASDADAPVMSERREIRQLGQGGESGRGRSFDAASEPHGFGRDPDESHAQSAARPHRRGASESPTITAVSGRRVQRGKRGAGKSPARAFSAPTRWLSAITPNRGRETRALACCFEIAIEVRHHPSR